MPEFTDAELLAFLEEGLPVDRMTAIEQALRESVPFRQRLAALRNSRDQEGHTAGEIWRRWRLSCPSRTQLGSFLLGTTEADWTDYIDFHIHTVGCRICAANLADLRQSEQKEEDTAQRRRKFFQSSAGYLQGSSRASKSE
jgi:hypothetical protein